MAHTGQSRLEQDFKPISKKKKKKVAKVAEAKLQLEIMEKPEKPVAVKVRI